MGSDSDANLMNSIRVSHGVAIQEACLASSVPAEFFAALIANETGGNTNAKRFEKGVLSSLWEVLQGRAAHFGSIGRDDVFQYIVLAGDAIPSDYAGARNSLTITMQRLDGLATSWGITQIMGYEAIPFGIRTGALTDPPACLRYTARMLADFLKRFDLDVTKDFSELFTCWNTGRPHAQTADPNYVSNGLARMNLYRELLVQT